MTTKTKVLRFDKQNWKEPVICELARNFDVTFSILKAKILPRQAGVLVLEITGKDEAFIQIDQYLKRVGVSAEAIEQDIAWDEKQCSQCGMCVGFCPSKALYIKDRSTMEVTFNGEKCVGCKLCLSACPSRALTMDDILDI